MPRNIGTTYMRELLPTEIEGAQIDRQRARVAANFKQCGVSGALLLGLPGSCSADSNRLPDGTLAMLHHGCRMAAAAGNTASTLFGLRLDGEKPRTSTGMTGLIHKKGGANVYVEAARSLHAAGVPLAAEIVSDVGAAVMLPHLTIARIGARESSATAPRYAVRPSKQDIDNGAHPVAVLLKSGQNGSLKHTINAIHTIRSDKPETRLRFGLNGLEEVETVSNPHIGITLRGNDIRPDGDLIDIVGTELYEARGELDREFGKNVVPITLDFSHAYAKYGYKDGGEPGQLAMAAAAQELIRLGAPLDGWTAETYILPDKQSDTGLVPGLSLTDKCVGQENAEELVLTMDEAWVVRSLANNLITV